MDETGQRSLRIESLNPTHLSRWPDLINGDNLPRFQEFLFGDWLSRFEQRFPDLIPSRSPRCLVAVEADRVVASVVARPFNRRGSCWTLQLPEQLDTDCSHSLRTIQQALLQQALQRGALQVCSWVIRCTTTDADAIALMRELGFQPLRAYQQWLPPKSVARHATPPLPGALQWAALNRRNAQLLWPIEQGGSFSHLRQITALHWIDLFDRKGSGCGVLMEGDAVLAGCLRLPEGGRRETFELLRDLAWDPRLDQALPWVLARIHQQGRPSSLLTALDDDPLSRVLDAQGWKKGDEQLLLGRSMWRRQQAPRNLQLSRSLDQVLGRLRPQGTPLPTPTLGSRR